jgi:hypothetical protein
MVSALPPWSNPLWDQLAGRVGLALTLLGLALAWWQARKAATAAEAARQAVTSTQQQIVAKQLQLALHQMRWVVGEIDRAIQANKSDLAKIYLDNWRLQASHIHGMLSGADVVDIEVLEALNQSVSLAKSVSDKLLLGGKEPLAPRCTRAYVAIGKAIDLVAMWAGHNSMQVSVGEPRNG